MNLLHKLLAFLLPRKRKRIHTYASFATLQEAIRFKRALIETREDVIIEGITETPDELAYLTIDIDEPQDENFFVFYSAYEPLP